MKERYNIMIENVGLPVENDKKLGIFARLTPNEFLELSSLVLDYITEKENSDSEKEEGK
jgi:hypothetical protein